MGLRERVFDHEFGYGFVSSLLAALKEVPELDDKRLAEFRGFPYPLYTEEQVVLSQIYGANAFKTLAIIWWRSINKNFGHPNGCYGFGAMLSCSLERLIAALKDFGRI
jgi:hypothetical protein